METRLFDLFGGTTDKPTVQEYIDVMKVALGPEGANIVAGEVDSVVKQSAAWIQQKSFTLSEEIPNIPGRVWLATE